MSLQADNAILHENWRIMGYRVAALQSKLEMVREFLRREITENLDHCESSHRYNNGACLLCNAQELLKELDEKNQTTTRPQKTQS